MAVEMNRPMIPNRTQAIINFSMLPHLGRYKPQNRQQIVEIHYDLLHGIFNHIPRDLDADQTTHMIFDTFQEIMPFTSRHSTKVAEITRRLVQEYETVTGKQFYPGERKIIERAALLHDIGKIGNLSITHKEVYDEDDFVLRTYHPDFSRFVLSMFPSLQAEAEIVFQHHEKLHGRGYPQQLKDGEIVLPAKIIMVADSYHSMVIDASWNKHIPHEHAIFNLVLGVERNKFDLQVVKALMNIPAPELKTLSHMD